ncbi:MAG: energy transducer TonB [FCB group bacterium]|nr:energy transducer TonB [FCB group bacterium]
MRIDPLIEKYPVRVRSIAIYVIFGISLIFYAFPRLLGEAKKIDQNSNDFVIENVDIPETEQMKIPEPPSRPSIPVASDDEFLDEDLTIEDTEFDDLDEWDAPPPPPSDDGPRIKFIPYDEPPIPRTAIRPVYPDIAQEAGIEGKVIVDFFVDENGDVTDIYVYQGIPNTGLNEAAMDAIRKTKFKPAMQRDRKVGVWIRQAINFSLSDTN